MKEHENIVTLLLNQGADIDAIGGEYGTPLRAAVFMGNEKIVSLASRY